MSVWLNPEVVTFGGKELTHVRSVRVQSVPFDTNASLASERIMGFPPNPMDVQIETRVERDITGPIDPYDLPGTSGTLMFEVALGRSDGYRQRITLEATLAWSTLVFDREKPARQIGRYLTISSGGNLNSLIQVDEVKPINV